MSYQITARTATEMQEPAERRDVIGFLLFAGIEWTDRHPGVMLAVLGVLIVLAGVLEGLLP